MELYNQHHEEGQCKHVPIRGSMVILVTKLLVTLLLFELVYGSVYYILALGIPLPFDLHHHVALVLFSIEIVKILMQTFLILHVTLSWANNAYYINGKHLVKRTGIINTEENMYEFNTVRSLTVHQSWVGRIFHFGDVILKTSASGGYQVIVTIAGIQNPRRYEQMIKNCL